MVAALITSYVPPMLVAIPAFLEARTGECCTMRMLHMIHSFDLAMKSTSMTKNKATSWLAPLIMKFSAFLVISVIMYLISFTSLPIASASLAFNEQAFADFVLIMIAVRIAASKSKFAREAIAWLRFGVVSTTSLWKKTSLYVARLGYFKMFALARIVAILAVSAQLTHPMIRFIGIVTLLEFNCVFTHFVVNQKKRADAPFCRKFAQSIVVAFIVTFIPALRILVIVLMFDRHVLPCLRPFMTLVKKSAKKGKKN